MGKHTEAVIIGGFAAGLVAGILLLCMMLSSVQILTEQEAASNPNGTRSGTTLVIDMDKGLTIPSMHVSSPTYGGPEVISSEEDMSFRLYDEQSARFAEEEKVD